MTGTSILYPVLTFVLFNFLMCRLSFRFYFSGTFFRGGCDCRIFLNICEGPTLPELEWQGRIAKQMNWPGRFVVLPRERTPKHLLLPGNAAQHVVATSERIRTELRYKELVEIEEAIQRTVTWEQRNPPQSCARQV
jgi:nucleoside-diphosphate-sugar epimerase